MAKAKVHYQCSACAATSTKWSGQCVDCGEWNTLEESLDPPPRRRAGGQQRALRGLRRRAESAIVNAGDVELVAEARTTTGLSELDRGARRGARPGLGHASRGRPRHRQVHPPDPVAREPQRAPPRALRDRRGVAAAGDAACPPPRAPAVEAPPPGRDPRRGDPRARRAREARGDGGRLDPDHLHRDADLRPRRRRPGARERGEARAPTPSSRAPRSFSSVT